MSALCGVAAAFLAVLLLAGCGHSRTTVGAGPVLTPGDLGLPEQACASTGFVVFEEGRTTGRFPTALAIAKLASAEGPGTSPGWRPTTLKEEQAIYWNSVLNSVPAIREVVVMGERTPGPPGAGVPAIAVTAGRLRASLCLVYGPAAAGSGEAALIGALLRTRDGAAIACIRAHVTPAEFGDRRPDGFPSDERHIDAEYLVARKFEEQVRLCVIDLVTRDSTPSYSPGSSSQTALSAGND